MPITYTISGFRNYIIIDKIMYRKAYKVKLKDARKWQYRNKREIKQVDNNGTLGYILVKNKVRKFYSLKFLRTKLKRLPIE